MANAEGRRADREITMRIWTTALLCLSVVLGIVLRVQNLPLLDEQYFLGTDAYRQVRQGEQILEQGKLPQVDMMRSAPIGRNNAEQFTLYPHVLAYAVRGLRFLLPDIALTKAAIFYPVVGFALILPLFFLLARQLTDASTALLASVGLSVAPTFLPRTMAGFADRDAFTMLLLLSTLYFWTLSWSATNGRWQMGFALLSGLTTGLLGRTWAGVGYLTTILSLWNLAYLLTDRFTTRRYISLRLWSIPALALMLSSAAFHRHFSDSFTWLALVPSQDSSVISQALQQLWSDPMLGLQIARCARRRVEQHYSWDMIVAQVEKAYEQICSEHNAPSQTRV